MKLIEKSRSANKRVGKMGFLFVLMLLGISAITISAFSFALPSSQTQAMENESVTKKYNIEIYANGKLFDFLPLASDSASYSYLIFRVNTETARTPEGEKVFAFQILRKIEKDSMQIEVLALLEDPNTVSEAHPMDKLKKQPVATYNIVEGEKIALSEMTKFGVHPLEIRVIPRDETNLANEDRPTKIVTTYLLRSGEKQDKKGIEERTIEQSDTIAKEDGITPLRILNKPTPMYTDAARKNETTGSVKLRVTFLASGIIGDVISVNMLPDGLTESAIEAAKGIKFQPATKNGTPLTVTKLVEYSFATF